MIAGAAIAALSCALRVAGIVVPSPLNCLELYPTPDLGAASGTLALRPVSSPFGVAVTVDGRTRYRLVATIEGLPAPRSLGDFTTYVAWAYTVSLDSAVNLGEVRNGTVELGELAYAQFRILVSAEKSARGLERRGRLVLRGTSPSARLLAHRDLLQPASMGALADSVAAGATMAGHAMPRLAPGATTWTMPPMAPRSTMMRGMNGLVPSTSAFLPARGGRPAAPRTTIRATTGDTVTLEARRVSTTIAGKPVEMFGYNGSVPGPLIEVRQGTSIVVRYRNAVELPNSIHWHGVRLDNASDGAVGLTQPVVALGDSFAYALRFPDAGIYWYHPHAREDVQQALGLYGNIIVRPADASYYSPATREEVWMLSDVLLGDAGLTPFGTAAPTHALMGRWGNVLLVNGQTGYRARASRGDVVRLFLTNASSARTYNLSFGGAGARMKLVAGDGGKFEREEWVQSVVIAPSERYVVDVEFARTGVVPLVNRVQALDHMIGVYSREVDTVATVMVADSPTGTNYHRAFERLRRNAGVSADIARFRGALARPVDHELLVTLRTENLPAAVANMLIGVNAPLEWNDGMPMMNWLATGHEVTWLLRDPATGKENMDIDWRFRRGDAVKLRIFNDPSSSHAMAHPIHLHGQRFLVLTRDGVQSENLVWKDTAIIQAGETVELLVDMANPGRWMLHCHIAEHLSAGMMASFFVQ